MVFVDADVERFEDGMLIPHGVMAVVLLEIVSARKDSNPRQTCFLSMNQCLRSGLRIPERKFFLKGWKAWGAGRQAARTHLFQSQSAPLGVELSWVG
jgi:hypothetical protein